MLSRSWAKKVEHVFVAVDKAGGWYLVPDDVSGLKIFEFKRTVKPILADDGCDLPKGMLAHVYLSTATNVLEDAARRTYYEWSGIDSLAEVKLKLRQLLHLEPTVPRNVFVQLAPLAAAADALSDREYLRPCFAQST